MLSNWMNFHMYMYQITSANGGIVSVHEDVPLSDQWCSPFSPSFSLALNNFETDRLLLLKQASAIDVQFESSFLSA